MSNMAERIMREYPQMAMERNCLENQIRNFQGITETEMIDAMHFSKPDGERVQNSKISDKTGCVAITYKDKLDRINAQWQAHLVKKHTILADEMAFFESAVCSLSGNLPGVISDMVIKGLTWDELASKYHISRTMVAKSRKKAIHELENLYAIRDKEMAEYMLS